MHLRGKRRGSSKGCGRPWQRRCSRSDEAEVAEAGCGSTLTAQGTDQQAIKPAERDSDCRRGSRHSRQTEVKKTVVNGTAFSAREPEARSAVRTVMAGTGEVLAADMADSTPLLQQLDWDGLLQRLQQDGYLLLRGVLPANTVLKVHYGLLTAGRCSSLHTYFCV
jgi:hypothetical protein